MGRLFKRKYNNISNNKSIHIILVFDLRAVSDF
jgi:hypothetical protein